MQLSRSSIGHKVILLSIAALASCSPAQPGARAKENTEALRSVLTTQMPSLSGPQRSLAEYRGQVVMLHFMASWCRQCAAEAPGINNLKSSFDGSPFAVVGVLVDDDPFQAQVFASRHNIKHPLLLDITGDLKTFFGVKEVPTTIFLNKEGTPITFVDPVKGNTTAKLEGPRVWDSAGPVEMIASLVESEK